MVEKSKPSKQELEWFQLNAAITTRNLVGHEYHDTPQLSNQLPTLRNWEQVEEQIKINLATYKNSI
jgi:hypothetical protein